MNIAPINFNGVDSKYKAPKFKKNDYANTTTSNNNIDTFKFEATNKIAEKNISFKGVEKGFAKLSNYEGLGKMMDHFSYLEKCDPNKSKDIKIVKDFIIALNDKAKSRGQEVCLNWRKLDNSEKFSFNNTLYTFADENYNKFFAKKNFSIGGPGDMLQRLIDNSEKLDAGEYKGDDYWPGLYAYKTKDFTIKDLVMTCILNTTKKATNTYNNSTNCVIDLLDTMNWQIEKLMIHNALGE